MKLLHCTLPALIVAALWLASCTPAPAASIAPTDASLANPASDLPTATAQAVVEGNDLSALSYTQAFEHLLAAARQTYAFNGVPGKQPEWESVAARVRPMVEQAEASGDAQAFFLALREFSLAFQDGNVNLGGGEVQVKLFQIETEGGYGFAIRVLDDGRALVTYVLPGGPADAAGMLAGAEVRGWNDQPILSAIEANRVWGAPPSSQGVLRYQQARYLLRARVGTPAQVTFANPGRASQTAALTAVAERESFSATSLFVSYNASSLPVESKILPSGLGYVRVTSTIDNREQVLDQFEAALQQLQTAGVPGLIIDLRTVVNLTPETNLSTLGLAGFFIQDPIYLGQLQYPARSGGFENEGAPEAILPRAVYYSFPAMALLVGPGCARTCELEAYALSQLPGTIVVGAAPTAGVLSDVARGQFLLPEGFTFQFPTGRYVLPDESIFLEGQGVALILRVPVDESTVFDLDALVLQTAEQAILK